MTCDLTLLPPSDTMQPSESAELDIGEDCDSGSSLDSQTVSRPSHHQFSEFNSQTVSDR